MRQWCLRTVKLKRRSQHWQLSTSLSFTYGRQPAGNVRLSSTLTHPPVAGLSAKNSRAHTRTRTRTHAPSCVCPRDCSGAAMCSREHSSTTPVGTRAGQSESGKPNQPTKKKKNKKKHPATPRHATRQGQGACVRRSFGAESCRVCSISAGNFETAQGNITQRAPWTWQFQWRWPALLGLLSSP